MTTEIPAWTRETFGAQVDPYRRELLVHSYRMLGSMDDAEDAVQDALTRAWQGRDTYVRSISLRAWLYKITTNACLNAIERRTRSRREGSSRWTVVPVPDDVLGGLAAWDPGPEGRYAARESVSLAFLAALQVLPPRQRAVLLLRDVLAWRAAEVAELLEISVPAVNSSLQRARATLRDRFGRGGDQPPDVAKQAGPQVTALVERYVRAWEAADIPGLVRLLRDDALLAMPPMPTVVGAQAIGSFLRDVHFASGGGHRVIQTGANGQPAFIDFAQGGAGEPIAAVALIVLSVDGDGITRLDAYADPRVIARFGPHAALPG